MKEKVQKTCQSIMFHILQNCFRATINFRYEFQPFLFTMNANDEHKKKLFKLRVYTYHRHTQTRPAGIR